ncbi:hypothetical protein LG52_295 [Geobacillus kaustophilus]|uniref:Uncharacterized protein n=1 Tax=Geobacillus kaustophilus TaxID=1462 RepID=A0A0D8BRI6_GEOKU|nr:hypothetical protein LG52_295 [Geobacillus kaustophilus]
MARQNRLSNDLGSLGCVGDSILVVCVFLHTVKRNMWKGWETVSFRHYGPTFAAEPTLTFPMVVD